MSRRSSSTAHSFASLASNTSPPHSVWADCSFCIFFHVCSTLGGCPFNPGLFRVFNPLLAESTPICLTSMSGGPFQPRCHSVPKAFSTLGLLNTEWPPPVSSKWLDKAFGLRARRLNMLENEGLAPDMEVSQIGEGVYFGLGKSSESTTKSTSKSMYVSRPHSLCVLRGPGRRSVVVKDSKSG